MSPPYPPQYSAPPPPPAAQPPPMQYPPPPPYPQQYPPQYAYPYPPPPMTYMAPPQPGKQTFEGLGRLRVATMLAIVLGVVGLLVGLLIIAMMGALTGGDLATLLGIGFMFIMFGIVIFIIGLIALIFALMGLYTLHEGRMEFGNAHAASVKKGVNFIIFGMVAQLAAILSTVFLTIGTFMTFAVDPVALRNSLLTSAIVFGVLSLAAVVLYGLGMQNLLERLVTARGRGLRMPFLGLAVGGGALALVLEVVSVFIFNPFALDATQGLGSLASVVSLVSLYLYFMQLKDAELGARTMIQTGQFNPDATGPAPVPLAPPPV